MKRQKLYRSLPELLYELTLLQDPEDCHLKGCHRVSWQTCTALTILAGDGAFYMRVEYLAIAEFTGIYLPVALHYISMLCIGFQANLDRICVPYLLTITDEPDSHNILFKV